MIVLDASIVVELLLNGPLAESMRASIGESTGPFAVPHLLDVEALSAWRRLSQGRAVGETRHARFLEGLRSLPAERYPHAPLLNRIWELRQNFTAYDAAYIALAEALGAVLYTSDAKLVRGHRAQVRLFRGARS